MKKAIILVSTFVGIWLTYNLYLLGYLPMDILPIGFTKLTPPDSTASLGDSAALLDSLFSSIALALGLIAILIQGRELKISTDAQTNQAISLSMQLRQQEKSNRLSAYSARLQYLLSEADRMDSKITDLIIQVEKISNEEEVSKKWQLIKNLRAKEVRYRAEAAEIDVLISEQLNET